KPLHRLLMTSAVYLQETAFDPAKAKIDPGNQLLWRRTPQRIESEILRDSMLAVSGKLNPQMLGPSFKPPIPAEAIQARNVKDPYPNNVTESAATRRRSIYMFHKRVVQYPLTQVFDGPDAQASCGRRDRTTVAPQALALLNDKFVRTRAEDFARRVAGEAGGAPQDSVSALHTPGGDFEQEVRYVWQQAFGRQPTATELASSIQFLDEQTSSQKGKGTPGNPGKADSHHLALTNFCQAVFALNEFVYVD
ncbi:MAG TPA: DUF1553 domain-containing protein, partial [Verrucomicrobiae bacterium]|nr:DUF1553 domain-containing protein [Verrucomicrobiae bacterium]